MTLSTIIVSTCGTSLLSNKVPSEQRDRIIKLANIHENNISKQDKLFLDTHAKNRLQELLNADDMQAKLMSAEINGILSYYQDTNSYASGNTHIFIQTDTYQGKLCVDILEKWTNKKKFQFERYKATNLNTENIKAFSYAIANIAKWCIERISPVKTEYCTIVFNLTGGFKSINGFVQALGMFYADEIIYLFENSNLLRIPSLPINLDTSTMNIIGENINLFRRLSYDMEYERNEIKNIPEIMLTEIDNGKVCLSAWGEIYFQKYCEQFYDKLFLDNPLPEKIIFSNKFINGIKKLKDKKRIQNINERIDDLSKFLLYGNSFNVKRLDFKQLQGNHKPSTHEIDAWAEGDAKRIFCHFENNILIIDELEKHL